MQKIVYGKNVLYDKMIDKGCRMRTYGYSWTFKGYLKK